MRASDFDFELPPSQIAQHPTAARPDARLLYVGGETLAQQHIRDLPSLCGRLFPRGALLVVNDTRVLPARLYGKKPTGGAVELLLVEPAGDRWRCLGRASKPIRPGPILLDGERAPRVEVVGNEGDLLLVEISPLDGEPLEAALDRVGHLPLPPYIDRADVASDRERYQTVFARVPGAVAAPTAGLHFTPQLLDELATAGVEKATVTLHVGLGTFQPLRSDEVDGHELHRERYHVPSATVAAFAAARAAGRPIVAVGTTSVRTLESAIGDDGQLRAGDGETRLFVKPGFRFRAVDALMTNFHLPRSTLLMLVCAFGGTERILAAYKTAVAAGFRFYSYGDAMLVTP